MWNEKSDPYKHIGSNKHAKSYVNAFGQRWVACVDCEITHTCSIGMKVEAGNDSEYGCCAGSPKSGTFGGKNE